MAIFSLNVKWPYSCMYVQVLKSCSMRRTGDLNNFSFGELKILSQEKYFLGLNVFMHVCLTNTSLPHTAFIYKIC